MPGKKHVCPVDKRLFATAQALAQHRRDSHGGVAAGAGRNRAGRGRSRNGFSGLPRSVVVAPAGIPANDSSAAELHGEDRVASFKVVPSRSLVVNYVVAGGLSERLHSIARTYEKMRWLDVEMFVSPQAPMTTLGGYVAGFLMDPEDKSVTLAQLSATLGAQTKKWYETARIRMPQNTFPFFTHRGTDPRMSSPGRFWILSDGAPTQEIKVVVTIKWRVRFMFASVGDSVIFNISVDVYTKRSNYNLQGKNPKGELVDDFSAVFAGTKNLDRTYNWFRVPTFNIEYSEGTGDTGTLQMHYVVYSTFDKKLYYSDNENAIVQTPWQSDVPEQVAIPKGTLLRYAGSKDNYQVFPDGRLAQPSLESMVGLNSNLFSSELLQVLRGLLNYLETGRPGSSSNSQSYEEVELPDSEK